MKNKDKEKKINKLNLVVFVVVFLCVSVILFLPMFLEYLKKSNLEFSYQVINCLNEILENNKNEIKDVENINNIFAENGFNLTKLNNNIQNEILVYNKSLNQMQIVKQKNDKFNFEKIKNDEIWLFINSNKCVLAQEKIYPEKIKINYYINDCVNEIFYFKYCCEIKISPQAQNNILKFGLRNKKMIDVGEIKISGNLKNLFINAPYATLNFNGKVSEIVVENLHQDKISKIYGEIKNFNVTRGKIQICESAKIEKLVFSSLFAGARVENYGQIALVKSLILSQMEVSDIPSRNSILNYGYIGNKNEIKLIS